MVRTVSLKNFDFASQTDKGKVRERNEDFLAYFDTINGHVFVVCDGMGGHNAGDVASELAVEAIGNFFNQKYYPNPFEAVEESILYANKVVYDHAKGNDYLYGMGTTIVLVLIRDDLIYHGHAGDSRLYLFKNNILDQVTKDHSRVQELIDLGKITKKEAEDHPLKNEITRALGLSMRFEPEVSPKAIVPQDKDILMICTDGLTNMLSDGEIARYLDNMLNLNDKASKLIYKANKKGGQDNISVQLIKFYNLGLNDEPDEEDKNELLTFIRDLLNKKQFVYIVAFLFILGTSFVVGLHESMKMENVTVYERSSDILKENDLIIAYLLKPYENLESLAERFNTDVETLKRLNPNYANIQQGKHLKIPVRYLHIVTQTDELPLIAAQYDSDIVDIMKANDLGNTQLVVGSEIIIPLKSKKIVN